MDSLLLKGLRFHALHGYHDFERRDGNTFEVDLTFWFDLRSSGGSDDLTLTVDYAQASAIVKQVMDGESVKLIETLATRIGDRLCEAFPDVPRLEVTLRKLSPPMDISSEYAEIRLTWPV